MTTENGNRKRQLRTAIVNDNRERKRKIIKSMTDMNKIEKALQRTTDTKALIIENGATRRVPEMFRSLFGEKKAVVIADKNTYAVAGKIVNEELEKTGIATAKPLIIEDADLFAEWHFMEMVENHLRASGAIPVAVGSGVINDLTKYASTLLNLKYMIVGTAASMDGYTAFGASITYKGNKQTFDCHAPYGMVFDPEIAAKAPKGMSASGYADLIAKIPAGADWMLAEAAGAEPIDKFSFDLVQDDLKEALSEPDAVAAGEVKPTEKLAEGLIMSGFAMQALQTSRPASGMEHQFSHYWDMEGLCYQGKHVSHGFKVGIGTLVSTACYEFLLNYDFSKLNAGKCAEMWPEWDGMKKEIEEIFKEKPTLRERALKESKAKYVSGEAIKKEIEDVRKAWPELKNELKKQLYSFDKIKDMLKRVGAPYEPEMIGVSRERLKETFRGIPYMRSRYSAIDFILRAGLTGDVTTCLFGKGGRWEI